MPGLLGELEALMESCSADHGDCDCCPMLERCRGLWDECIDGPRYGKARAAAFLQAFRALPTTRALASKSDASSAKDIALLERLMS